MMDHNYEGGKMKKMNGRMSVRAAVEDEGSSMWGAK